MRNKRNAGMTLIELLLAMSLLMLVMAAAGGALAAGTRAYRLNYEMEHDQYHTSMFLLEITRKLHMGVSDITFAGNALTLTDMASPATVTTYEIIDNEVYQDGAPCGIRLSSMAVTKIEDATPSGNVRIKVTAVGEYGMELDTTVALFRLPKGGGSSEE